MIATSSLHLLQGCYEKTALMEFRLYSGMFTAKTPFALPGESKIGLTVKLYPDSLIEYSLSDIFCH